MVDSSSLTRDRRRSDRRSLNPENQQIQRAAGSSRLAGNNPPNLANPPLRSRRQRIEHAQGGLLVCGSPLPPDSWPRLTGGAVWLESSLGLRAAAVRPLTAGAAVLPLDQ